MPEEIPGLLERLAEVPDPRDPRGVRHTLVDVLTLTACAVMTGSTSLLAGVSGSATPRCPSWAPWRTARPALSPNRCPPAEATIRRLLGRIDGDVSQSRARRREFTNHANMRSATQRLRSTTNPVMSSVRLTISKVRARLSRHQSTRPPV
ncbi:transposase family protein [Streptomyces sp. NPDC054834]